MLRKATCSSASHPATKSQGEVCVLVLLLLRPEQVFEVAVVLELVERQVEQQEWQALVGRLDRPDPYSATLS